MRYKFKVHERVKVLALPEGETYQEAPSSQSCKHPKWVDRIGIITDRFKYNFEGSNNPHPTYLVVFDPSIYFKNGEAEIQQNLLVRWEPGFDDDRF